MAFDGLLMVQPPHLCQSKADLTLGDCLRGRAGSLAHLRASTSAGHFALLFRSTLYRYNRDGESSIFVLMSILLRRHHASINHYNSFNVGLPGRGSWKLLTLTSKRPNNTLG